MNEETGFKNSWNAGVLTDLAVFAGSTGRALAHVSSLRQDVASGTVLTRLADARVQRLLAVSAGELWRAYAPVVRRLVLLHRIVTVIVIFLVLQLGIEIAFSRILLGPPLVDRRAVGTLASDYVHPDTFTVAAPVVPTFTPLLQSPAIPAIT